MSQHPPDQPTLRITHAPPGSPPDAADAPFAVDRLTALAHDLNSLLDGSMRCLSLARRALMRDGEDEQADALRRIETAYGAMERMADLVHAAMRGSGSVVGSPTLAPSRPITLEEAVMHAADVLYPEAEQRGVRLAISMDAGSRGLPVGPLYSVLLNGMRNAIEAIGRVEPDDRGVRTGMMEVAAAMRARRPTDDPLIDTAVIEIRDDGRGFPGTLDPAHGFDLGFTTKPGSLGVGLALAREVVRELGGSVELLRRTDRAVPGRPGMILRIYYPVVRREERAHG
jgi:signal transduction histidine kinase